MRIRVNGLSSYFIALCGSIVMVVSLPVTAAMLVSTGTNGSLGYTHRMSDHSTGTKENQSLIQANLDNSFFIWQDWFATGSANLTFTQQDTTTTQGQGSSQAVTGRVGLNGLPQSKYPFNFSYSRADSKISPTAKPTDGSDVDDHVVSDTVSVSQSYVGDLFRATVRHSGSQYKSSKRGDYGSDALDLSTIFRPKGHVLRASFGLKNSKSYDGVDRKSNVVSLDHGYTGHRQITVNTVVSTSQLDQESGTVAADNLYTHTMKMDQASMNVVWRSKNLKTRITSNLRYFGMDMVVIDPTKNGKMANVSANLGAVHRFSPNLDVNASIVRVQDVLTDSGGENGLARDQIGVNYRSDRIGLGKITYNWRASADLGQYKEGQASTIEAGLTFGHVISRDWRFTGKQRVRFRGYQDLSSTTTNSSDSASESQQRVNHRLTLDWSQSSATVKRQAQAAFSDRRDLNVTNTMQVFSVDLSQHNNLTSRIKLGGNLNYQLTNYEYASASGGSSTESSTSVTTVSANLAYMNPFSIAGMVFNSDFRYSQSAVAQSVDLSGQQVWNNKLIYRVGKIDTSLQYMYREARKISYNMVYFNVKRVF